MRDFYAAYCIFLAGFLDYCEASKRTKRQVGVCGPGSTPQFDGGYPVACFPSTNVFGGYLCQPPFVCQRFMATGGFYCCTPLTMQPPTTTPMPIGQATCPDGSITAMSCTSSAQCPWQQFCTLARTWAGMTAQYCCQSSGGSGTSVIAATTDCPNNGQAYIYPGTSIPQTCQPGSSQSMSAFGSTCPLGYTCLFSASRQTNVCCNSAGMSLQALAMNLPRIWQCNSGRTAYVPTSCPAQSSSWCFVGQYQLCSQALGGINVCPEGSFCDQGLQMGRQFVCCGQSGSTFGGLPSPIPPVCGPGGYAYMMNNAPVTCSPVGPMTSFSFGLNCPPPFNCQLYTPTSIYYCCTSASSGTLSRPTIPTVCSQPQSAGTCFTITPRYWYNAQLQRCEAFTYTGCGGNQNNFGSIADCINTCAGVIAMG